MNGTLRAIGSSGRARDKAARAAGYAGALIANDPGSGEQTP
jgi:hypothetical protein